MQQDIIKQSEFVQGAARFSRMDKNLKTGVEAWRRTYTHEPQRNVVEIFVPDRGRFYPEENRIMRRIKERDPRLVEKVEFYLKNGLSGFFPGDEKKSIFDDSDE